MTAPTPKVEVGYGSTWTTPDASIAWTDETSHVLFEAQISGSRGRGAVLERFNASDFSLTFLNSDRRFDPNYSGNRLTVNQADIETDTTGWSAVFGSCTLSRITSQSNHGAASMQMASTGAATFAASTPADVTGIPVTVGETYTALASFRRISATANRQVHVDIGWLDSAGAFLSTSSGSQTADNNSGWTARTVTAVAPASAVYAYVTVAVESAAGAGEQHAVDTISFAAGSSTTWEQRYFGNLIPGVPVRVTTTPSGQSSRAVLRGFITGFKQRYDLGNTRALVPVQAYGIFDKVARAKLPQSAVDVEVLADDPVAYWKLDDNTEAEMLDSSGNDNHGIFDNPDLGQDALVADGGSAVSFDHVGDHRGKIAEALLSGYPFTLEAWVKFPRDLSQNHVFLSTLNDTSASKSILFNCKDNAGSGNPNGHMGIVTSGFSALGSTRVDDDVKHYVAVVVTDATTVALYVDGVAETVTSAGSATYTLSALRLYAVGNLWDTKLGDFGLGGTIDNVAIYDSALDASRVLEHYNAGAAPYDGDTPDERLDRILDVIGVPADRRDFETCLTILGPTVLNQQRALDYMRLVEASEDGRMFETADGKIRFLDRYWGLTDTHATSSQQTFTDGAGVSYSDLQIDPDDELLVNVATVTREGAAALTRRNQTSIDTYGEADTSVSVLLQTDAEAVSLAEHLVLVRGEPEDRVSALSVPLHAYTGAQQAAILDLDIGYRITVDRTPQGVGATTTLSLIIEGIRHTINTFEHWIEFNVSVAPDAGNYWIWGTSTWGETTVWGW